MSVYEYDHNGNRTAELVNDAITHRYRYGKDNHLVDVDGIAFGLDAAGQIVSIRDQGQETLLSPDGHRDSWSISGSEQTVTTGTLAADEVLNWRGSSAADKRYAETDGTASVTSVSDRAGNIVERFDYQPFGAAGAPGDRYMGRPRYSGLVGFRCRYLDPESGSWTQQDPLRFADGPNYYAFVHDNPVNFGDPSGLAADSFSTALATNWWLFAELALANFFGATVMAYVAAEVVRRNEEALQKATETQAEPEMPPQLEVPVAPDCPPDDRTEPWHRHHVYPQAFAAYFSRAAVDMHSRTKVIPLSVHKNLHRGSFGSGGGWWNAQWRTFFSGNFQPDRGDIMGFGDALEVETWIWWYPTVAYGSPYEDPWDLL